MSMSIASLRKLSADLNAIGKDHVFIGKDHAPGGNDGVLAHNITNGWFGRWVNRFFSNTLGCGKADNTAVCDKFVKLIEKTPELGEKYATLARDMLENVGRYSSGRPLSGRRAAMTLNMILAFAEKDIHDLDATPGAMASRGDTMFDLRGITTDVGEKSIPYALSLISRLQEENNAVPVKEIRRHLPLMMSFKQAEIRVISEKAYTPLLHNKIIGHTSEEIIQNLKPEVMRLRSSHLWEADRNPIATWTTPVISMSLETHLSIHQKYLGLSPGPQEKKEQEEIAKEISAPYGKDAEPYAKEFMSLPMVTEEQLRDEMKRIDCRLHMEATAIVDKELAEVRGQEKKAVLMHFIRQITTERGPSPRPIDQWMYSTLVDIANTKIQMLERLDQSFPA